MVRLSAALATALLGTQGFKELMDGGKLFLFSGPVPVTADAALDMVNSHTQAVVVTLNSSGTGLTFATPSGGFIGKTESEIWSGVVATDGKDGALTTIAPSFYRFGAGSDTCRTAGTGTSYRAQGTVGGPNSGADLQLGNGTLTEGNTQPIGAFGFGLPL